MAKISEIMKITDIKIRKINDEERLKCIASITINDLLAIHDIKVIKGNDGELFVSMPSKKHNEKFRDTVHPINIEFRNYIEEEILNAYYEQKTKSL